MRHTVYACWKCMRFQSQLGQTKIDFNNQDNNALQYVAFWLEIFLFKIEIKCGKKLKWHVAMSLKREYWARSEKNKMSSERQFANWLSRRLLRLVMTPFMNKPFSCRCSNIFRDYLESIIYFTISWSGIQVSDCGWRRKKRKRESYENMNKIFQWQIRRFFKTNLYSCFFR